MELMILLLVRGRCGTASKNTIAAIYMEMVFLLIVLGKVWYNKDTGLVVLSSCTG